MLILNHLKTTFLRGLLTLLPIAVTIYIVYAGLLIFENILAGFIKSFLPHQMGLTYCSLGFLLESKWCILFPKTLHKFVYTQRTEITQGFSHQKAAPATERYDRIEYTEFLSTEVRFDEMDSLEQEALFYFCVRRLRALLGEREIFAA